MTIDEIRERLKYRYEINNAARAHFPWDRGYLEGFADGIRYAYALLERLEKENQEHEIKEIFICGN